MQNWEMIYEGENYKAYVTFVEIFKLLNDKFSNKTLQYKTGYIDTPWITKGLQNVYKNKNTLYREFITCRTKEAENIYKV